MWHSGVWTEILNFDGTFWLHSDRFDSFWKILNFKCAFKRQTALKSNQLYGILEKKWQNKKNSFSTLNFLVIIETCQIILYSMLSHSQWYDFFSTSDLVLFFQFSRTRLCFNRAHSNIKTKYSIKCGNETFDIKKYCQMLIS